MGGGKVAGSSSLGRATENEAWGSSYVTDLWSGDGPRAAPVLISLVPAKSGS